MERNCDLGDSAQSCNMDFSEAPKCPSMIPMPSDYQDGTQRALDLSEEAQKKRTTD